jgi:hypothetical protein
MKAGVRIAPCGVVSFPVRAAPSVANSSKWLGTVMGSLWRDRAALFNLVRADFQPKTR